jgi:hypothetical protein
MILFCNVIENSITKILNDWKLNCDGCHILKFNDLERRWEFKYLMI